MCKITIIKKRRASALLFCLHELYCIVYNNHYDVSIYLFLIYTMQSIQKYDVALIGAGVMSATLCAMLHELDPTLTI